MSSATRAIGVLALVCAPFIGTFAVADPGDEVCFPLYRAAGAIPKTPQCPTTASRANVNLGNLQCTANFGANSSIPRYCGTLSKDLGKCPSTPYPISIGTANKYLHEIDFKSGEGGLTLSRYYNSAPVAAPGSMLGSTWRSNYDAVIATTSLGASATRPDGRIIYFTQVGGVFAADPDVNDSLVRLPASGTLVGWRYYDSSRSSIEVYDADGKLTKIQSASGRLLTLAYSDASTPLSVAPGPGYLLNVSDGFGRALSFIYDSSKKRVITVIMPDGQSIGLEYDAFSNISAVTYADGRARRYFYNESSFNGGVSQARALTGIQDENNDRYINYFYNNLGHAVGEQQIPSPSAVANEYKIIYDSLIGFDAASGQAKTAGQSTLTDPRGSKYVYTFTSIQGSVRLTGVSQPGGAGCQASSSAISYDANGNATSRDDFNGSRECKVYDLSRNLETTAVRGLLNTTSCAGVTGVGASLPVDARKTSTRWHPDWRLQTKVAEPKLLTTYVYNGQPDPFSSNAIATCAPANATLPDGKPIVALCKRVEQATSDPNGSQGFAASLVPTTPSRVWKYTYDHNGSVLSQTDPRNRLTSYVYFEDAHTDHSPGDLRTATNAASHVVRYTRYDKNGRVLQVVDPNGTTTDIVYSVRGLVQSVTISTSSGATQTTVYQNDAAGQLKSVQMPDGGVLSFTYDSAHRLIGVTDAAGNTVSYELDEAGNRVSETARDSAGDLARSITRVFDALNRVQQITGASN
ncbi:DUF6531 domain-containing protein [Pelomonas sp. UHG3]|uniref:DUF6531 domain-containing protein n=1 Tax=Roseateles hydrophilus TaxID=2975054 RepID=A0ACC6CGC5_9BURK|nr:DUF6531 domain-containing protein [Pelomonas sp. UHG3]MCY4747422.1 DUF6531 domain-containing protein [Pelomonas sp. UHG3]